MRTFELGGALLAALIGLTALSLVALPHAVAGELVPSRLAWLGSLYPLGLAAAGLDVLYLVGLCLGAYLHAARGAPGPPASRSSGSGAALATTTKVARSRLVETGPSTQGEATEGSVRRLRAKLRAGLVGGPTIVTARGFGYRLVPESAGAPAAGPASRSGRG